ncbi:GntR family transcriptional regulator [bacterium]|nr:MAG: GntR family transcriptional regulator [bacterium]
MSEVEARELPATEVGVAPAAPALAARSGSGIPLPAVKSRGPRKSSHEGARRLSRSQGFVEEVFRVIRADIMSLRIPPDTRISIDKLARELGVSQTPIREAMSMLEATGLVTRRHFVGYCSAPQLDRRQVDELYEVRLLLEPYAARCAAERMPEADVARLGELAASMQPGDSRTSYDRFAEQDAELHEMIAVGSGNRLIHEALGRLHTHLHIFRLRFHSEVTREAYAEHATLLQALARRDGPAAEAAMRAHIERSYQRLAPYALSTVT